MAVYAQINWPARPFLHPITMIPSSPSTAHSWHTAPSDPRTPVRTRRSGSLSSEENYTSSLLSNGEGWYDNLDLSIRSSPIHYKRKSTLPTNSYVHAQDRFSSSSPHSKISASLPPAKADETRAIQRVSIRDDVRTKPLVFDKVEPQAKKSSIDVGHWLAGVQKFGRQSLELEEQSPINRASAERMRQQQDPLSSPTHLAYLAASPIPLKSPNGLEAIGNIALFGSDSHALISQPGLPNTPVLRPPPIARTRHNSIIENATTKSNKQSPTVLSEANHINDRPIIAQPEKSYDPSRYIPKDLPKRTTGKIESGGYGSFQEETDLKEDKAEEKDSTIPSPV
jgi:hypothetical protein